MTYIYYGSGGWECPHCNTVHKYEYKRMRLEAHDHPDEWQGGASKFLFECDCGKTFKVYVEWVPEFSSESIE